MDQADWDYLHDRRFHLRLRVRMNRLYQQSRGTVMETREGAVKVASLLAGSVALANVADPAYVQTAAAVIFAGTAASLVFAWAAKGRDAARRSGEWAALERDIDAAGERTFTEAQLDAWTARCCAIESGEPAAHGRMIERAYRDACESLGAKPSPGGPAALWMPAMRVP